MNEQEMKARFSQRIRENYDDYLKEWLGQESEELIACAEEISATKLLAEKLLVTASPEDMEYFLLYENPLAVIRDGWLCYTGEDIKDDLSDTLRFVRDNPSIWKDYAKAPEQAALTDNEEPLTLREFLEKHQGEIFDMMTPGGYVYLTPQKAEHLLAGGTVMGNPGCPGFDMPITAEELLEQVVCSANYSKGEWQILSNCALEQEQASSGMEVAMC